MTLFSRVTEICRERLPSIRVARITIDSIFDLDSMLQPGIRFGVTVKNTGEFVGTPIAYIGYFFFEVDVMDGAEEWIIQKISNWHNGTYRSFYRIFYKGVCQTRLDGEDGVELGWRNADWLGKPDVYNLSVNVPAVEGYYTMDKDDLETPYAPDYVPVENRKVGLLITFMSYTGWQTWQYKGIEAQIGEVLEADWLNTYYWKQKDAESLLTKAAIEEELTGDIETHTHGHLNQLCELVAVRTSDPDITIVQYEQGAKYYNSHTNFIHTLDYSDMAYPWFNAEQPKVGVLYYSLSDESSSYAKLWRYTGTEMLEIPVHPSLAFDTALRETAVNVASVGDIHAVSLTPQTNNIQYIVIPSDYALSTVFIELIMDSIISGMFIMDLYVYVESSATPILNLTNTSEVLDRYLYFKPGYSIPATLAKGLHHFRFIRDMSELVNVNLHVEHTYSTLALLEAHSGVYNLTENVPPTDDFYTLSVMSTEAQYAPAHVPVGVRKNGLIITFRSHSEWETWQFTDAYGDFSAAGNWKRIDAFIEQGVYDMDQQSPLLSGQYYQCSNDDDDYYIPSSIPEELRVAFMKVRYINSYGQRVILRYASSDFAYFHNYDYWDVLKVSDLSSADIEKMLTGLITTHYHDTIQTDRVTPVEAVNAPIARSFSLDPHSAGQGYLIITDAYTFSATITIELTMSYLIQDSFYRYVLYIDMRHAGPLHLTITKNVANIILKGDSTLNIALAKGIYKIEFIRQMSDLSNLVLYARHDFIPDDI